MGRQLKCHMLKGKGKNKKNIESQIDEENQSHHIPNDLIFNILPRLPGKSLVRFKCVSKSWFSFISQLKLSNQKLLFSNEHCIQSVDLEALPKMVIQALYFPLLLRQFEIIGSYNGLLCVVMKDEDAVVLCNPLTRTYRSISLSEVDPIFDRYDLFGFGYDHLTDDYKFLRVMGSSMFSFSSVNTLRIQIYSLNSDSWKFKKFTLPCAHIYLSESATFVKGALYWGIHCTNEILCYDLIDEKVRVIQLPDNVGMTNDLFDLCDLGGSLSMIDYQYKSPDYKIDIWTLEEDNWIKLMSIPRTEVSFYHKCLKPVCLMKDGQVLMKVDGTNVFCLFSPDEKKFRNFKIEDINIRYGARFHSGITYSETLVSPFRLKKTLSVTGTLAQRVLEMVTTKKHVCNMRKKCVRHPRVNWKQWQRQDQTKKKGYKKVVIA